MDCDKEEHEITDKDGNNHYPSRSELRHRKRHGIVFGHVSDDKSHDEYAMMHFIKTELKDIEEYMNTNFPKDIPDGQIRRLTTKSDNSASHFKSKGSIHFYTTLINDRGGPSKKNGMVLVEL